MIIHTQLLLQKYIQEKSYDGDINFWLSSTFLHIFNTETFITLTTRTHYCNSSLWKYTLRVIQALCSVQGFFVFSRWCRMFISQFCTQNSIWILWLLYICVYWRNYIETLQCKMPSNIVIVFSQLQTSLCVSLFSVGWQKTRFIYNSYTYQNNNNINIHL